MYQIRDADIHQGAAQVCFLQSAVKDDIPRNTFQFHNGCAHHERDVPGTIHRKDRLGVNAAGIGDGRPGCGDCIDYSWGQISIEVEPMRRIESVPCEGGMSDSYVMDIDPDDIDVSDPVTVVWSISD